MIRLLFVFGTRPEAMMMAPVVLAASLAAFYHRKSFVPTG